MTWINPCIVEENEGGGVFLLPFSDILQVFQKSITKQYILEMLSGNGLEVSATIQTIRLGYRRIETEDKDGKRKRADHPGLGFYRYLQQSADGTATDRYG